MLELALSSVISRVNLRIAILIFRFCLSTCEVQIRSGLGLPHRGVGSFSKKWENLKAAIALYFAYYNFCRIHSSIRCTRAMEGSLTGHVWTLRELLTA
jgi:hypothetical protein